MRAGDVLRRDVLRMVANAAYGAEKKNQRPLTDDEYLAVIGREVKTRRESVEAYTNAGRQDLADKEQAEIDILSGYLPAPLSEAEIAGLIERGHRRHRRNVRPGPRQGHGLAVAADPWARRRKGRERSRGAGPCEGRPDGPRRRDALTGLPVGIS